MTKKLAYLCNLCGGTNVLLDAWSEWDGNRQQWVLSETFPTAFCRDCDGETKLIERELEAVD